MNVQGSFLDHDIAEFINPSVLCELTNNTVRDLSADEHTDNVYHGNINQCANFPTRRTKISLIVLRDCRDCNDLETRIRKLGKLNKFESVLKVVSAIDMTHQGSPEKYPCIITERIPSETFHEWIRKGQRLSALISFFRKLFSAISSFHQKDRFFGNLESGLRVRKNKPLLVFPARSNGAVDLDAGRVHDLRSLRDMVLAAFPKSADRDLFERLCNLYVPDDGITATANYLRSASYVILHCPLVWEGFDRFHFIMGLHLYRARDPVAYDMYVCDSSAYGYAVPSNWQIKLDRPRTNSAKILSGSKYREARARLKYLSSETIRYFERNAYQHLPGFPTPQEGVEDMLDVVNQVFPEIPTQLYEMAHDRLFLHQNILKAEFGKDKNWRSLYDFVKFFQTGAHCFQF